jgi:hypothetical protein
MGLLDAEPFVSAAGLTFLPCCEKEFPVGSVDQYVRGIGTRQGEEAQQFTIGACAAGTNAILNPLPATLKTAGVDALVLDAYQFYAELVPMSLGMPYVHVSNALHFDYSGYTPLHVYDWPHETGPEALARNRKGIASFHETVSRANWCFSIGHNLDPREIGPLPSNAITVKSAPQLELLKRTSVCITHAGLNTVLELLPKGFRKSLSQ